MNWLVPDISKRLAAPFTSTVRDRSATRLLLVTFQFAVHVAERYRKRDLTGDGHDETMCNIYARDWSRAMGYPFPDGLRANDIVEWMKDDGTFNAAPRWELVDDHTAQACAEHGMMSVAAWKNERGGPGHIAPLQPSLGEEGIWISQAGSVNFLRGRLEQGFGDLKPLFFVHP